MDYRYHYDSPLGRIALTSDGKSLSGLWFDDQKYPDSAPGKTPVRELLPVFEQTEEWLNIYFSGKAPDFVPPLSVNATPFRKAVWEILLSIPFGQTRTYGEIANEIAKQMGRRHMSAQAVGGAVGHNPISLIIPCHRVIGTDGSLTGYAGGIEKKMRLLAMEKGDIKALFSSGH